MDYKYCGINVHRARTMFTPTMFSRGRVLHLVRHVADDAVAAQQRGADAQGQLPESVAQVSDLAKDERACKMLRIAASALK